MFETIKNFLENREMRKVRKFWNERMNERYTQEHQKVLNAQFERDAQRILEEVLIPYFEKIEATHPGIRKIEVSISTIWGEENYRISSNIDPTLETYSYPTATEDFNGVWLAAIDLCPSKGIQGKGCIDEEWGDIEIRFVKQVA